MTNDQCLVSNGFHYSFLAGHRNSWTLMDSEELSRRLWQSAARVGKVVDALPETRLGRHVATQLVRCGTAAGPNHDEGCAAESRRDFAHKLSISLKELKETRGWVRFTVTADLMSESRVAPLLQEVEELIRILASSIATAKGRRRPNSARSSPDNDE
jgi:four helix bundle protein